MNAAEITRSIRDGKRSAVAVVEAALARIEARNPEINAFTRITAQRARAEATAIDKLRAQGATLPPLAGVPYAVKNLFDIEGVTTLAGSRINASQPPAARDATLVARLKRAGAVLVGALNMDEYAYGFTTENTHYGPTRNPHDLVRICGGSSGGSGAAVAAGLVPFALASDTNGSIRVPASLCGVFGLKPTYGRLPRTGSFPFVGSLDHLGPLAASAHDLAACYDAVLGYDAEDPACNPREAEPALPSLKQGVKGLRIARLSGYFDAFADDEARAAALRAAQALGTHNEAELPLPQHARAAAFVITAAEGGQLHLDDLRHRYADMEPLSRDRFAAGALTPAAWYLKAQKLRAWFLAEALKLFESYDLLIAPATPCSATPIGQEWLELRRNTLPLRSSMGLLTQPISFIGLPVAVAPIWTGTFPIGVQLIAPPWREDLCLRAAHVLEATGAAGRGICAAEASYA